MTAVREKLPNRRASETFETRVARRRYCAALYKFAYGRIAKVFQADHKSESDAAVTIFDTEAASRWAKNGSSVRDPGKDALHHMAAGLRRSSGRLWRAAQQRQ